MSKHKIEIFRFVKDGNEVEVKSKPYTFAIEEVLVKRFTKEKLHTFNQTGKFDAEIELDAIQEDFPKLLNEVDGINWQNQDYDELLRVYLFFIAYKRNALLRRFELEKKTLFSDLETMSKIINSLPDNILQKLNGKNTKSS